MIVGYFTFSEPESDTSELALPGSGPQNVPAVTHGTSGLEGKKPPLITGPGPAEPLPERPKTTTPVSQSERKPEFATENKAGNQSGEKAEVER
jgi:hypothetical protein